MMLLAALLIGCGAPTEEAESNANMRVVITEDIDVGHRITREMLTLVDVGPIGEHGFEKIDDVYGRWPVEPIYAGEMVRNERLTDPRAPKNITRIMPAGTRAIELQPDVLPQSVRAMDFVDVSVFVIGKSATIVQGAYVLGAYGPSGRLATASTVDPGPVERIVLGAKPDQVEMLRHADTQGFLVVSLRNPKDVELVK